MFAEQKSVDLDNPYLIKHIQDPANAQPTMKPFPQAKPISAGGCATPETSKECPVSGKPVNPILGCKILTEEPDVFIDAHLPLVWRRTYASDVAHEGMLGQGWSLDFGYRLEVLEEEIVLYDGYGKKDLFPVLQVGESHLIPKGSISLSRPSTQDYLCHIGNRYYHFHASKESQGVFRLRGIKDHNHNSIQFFYEKNKTFASFIALDNQRLFALQGNAHRLLGLEELVFDKSDLRKNLLRTDDALVLLHYHKQDQRKRLGSIETFSLDKEEALMAEYNIHEVQDATLKTMVRYVYSEDNDLIAVHGKEDLLLRTFDYRNHVMISHGVPEGLESYYEYDVYGAEGKVLKNHTNTGQVWHFDYQEGKTIVTDALRRETVYTYDKNNYFTSKINPLHQQSTIRYTPRGQVKEVVDATGRAQNFSYAENGAMIESGMGIMQSTKYRYHIKYHKPIAIEDDKGTTLFSYDTQANLL
ncbi:MAG: hypothetical protein DSZ08_06965, partial [Sulfurovum sp.]